MLSKDNVDQHALLEYARQAADMSTQHRLPNLEFAHNHYGQPDVAMFDFTSMFVAEHACRVVERQGYRLLVGLVGDTLLEVYVQTCNIFTSTLYGLLQLSNCFGFICPNVCVIRVINTPDIFVFYTISCCMTVSYYAATYIKLTAEIGMLA